MLKKIYLKFRKYRGKFIDSLPHNLSRWIIYNFRIKVPKIKKFQRKKLNQIKNKKSANVLFIASSLSMWKYEGIFKRLIEDNRFKVTVLIFPFPHYSKASQEDSAIQLNQYFSKFQNFKLLNIFQKNNDIENILSIDSIDIIFYTHPYQNTYNNHLDYNFNLDKLICYTPYGIGVCQDGITYNALFHNYAWKIFTSTKMHYEISYKYAHNRGENIVVIGNDNLKLRKSKSKSEFRNFKTLIWAPHFSIRQGLTFNHNSFINLYDFMINLPLMYKGQIKIIFKPHPNLKTLLYENPDWGKDRTDSYYKKWEIGEFTKLEEGDYRNAFLESDGMIHDSISFIGDYMYTGNPALYITNDKNFTAKECNDFGKKCLDLHYIGLSQKDILNFIDNVILKEDDPLKSNREAFISEVLNINSKKTPGDLAYENILQSLDWI